MVSEWKIDPGGVGKVVDQVQAHAERVEQLLSGSKLDGVLTDLSWGGEVIGCVPDAVGRAISSQVGLITDMVGRVQAGLEGAVGATLAYVHADEKMAAAMQSHARQAAVSGDFSWLMKHRQW